MNPLTEEKAVKNVVFTLELSYLFLSEYPAALLLLGQTTINTTSTP